MGKLYGSGINLKQTIGFTEKAPLDDRASVLTYADLANINAFIGIITYVKDEDIYYRWDGTRWIALNLDSAITGITIIALLDSVENLPTTGEAGDAYLVGNAENNTCYMWDVYKNKYVNIGPLRGKQGLDGLPGLQGIQGTDGKSDYEIAVEHGYTGTEQEWINSYFVSLKVFPALRALESEVQRLKNSFLFGINSYQGEDTAQSRVVDGYNEVDDKEPLWAIDEDDLSGIEDMNIEFNELHGLVVTEGTTVDVTDSGKLGITDAYWTDQYGLYKEKSDAKLIIYFATSGDKVSLHLDKLQEESEETEESETPELVLSLQGLTGTNTVESYHYMIIISRQYNGKGKRYVYISIDNNKTNLNLARGYYNTTTHLLQDDQFLLEEDYYLSKIHFELLDLTKLRFYSKFLDFSDEIIPVAPKEQDYKYEAAHLTIRGVKDKNTLEKVLNHLLKLELVWDDGSQSLYIKSPSRGLVKIGTLGTLGGGSNNDNYNDFDMDETELIELLKEKGIIIEDGQGLKLNSVSDITFINEDTAETFVVSVDAHGNLVTKKQSSATLADRITSGSTVLKLAGSRGLIGRIGEAEYKKLYPNADLTTTNIGLYSDRLKIGAVYMPLDTDKVFGCSHCYIELENTSNKDIPLTNCYLHYCYPKYNESSDSYTQTVKHLALEGTIKAGSTYLVRCAAKPVSANTFIHVDSYDLEWYNGGELLDLTAVDSIITNKDSVYGYGFALTYYQDSMASEVADNVINTINITASTKLCTANSYLAGFIDALVIGASAWTGNGWTVRSAMPIKSNCICKNTFELDPANQAYLALLATDSSRVRWNTGTDYQNLSLANEYIEFPNSDLKYPVSLFAPKASFEGKTVCSDKSKFDVNKPNMVTVSFGIDIHKTRCFNWLSAGLFDEYVWVRQKGTLTWQRFESYGGKNNDNGTSISKKTWSEDILNAVYNRKTATFPATGIIYTAHKCILNILSAAPSAPLEYEYVVGRADKNGNMDLEHCSEILEFTIYPSTYTPRVYQITDLQGFHWIEYQAWAAAAKAVNAKIIADTQSENIIPILINTGDMTLNGTRINEWLDYYNAGKCLFTHLEQMNVVGNNDLCNSVDLKDSIGHVVTVAHELLGTGDDNGKSNPYYFDISYCYEIDDSTVTVIYQGAEGSETKEINLTPIVNNKYIPSLYFFGNDKYIYIMVNSELTEAACRNLFGLSSGTEFYNIYTGCKVNTSTSQAVWGNPSWTPIYTQLYGILAEKAKNKTVLVACHEMPFTVITLNNVKISEITKSRSYDGTNGLVGSHLNLIVNGETGTGVYWFSRLLEHFNVKLCIGGHKHTYACTFPVRENYIYNGVPSVTAKMNMTPTLENDDVIWTTTADYSNGETTLNGEINLTKFPLVKTASFNGIKANTASFLPGIATPDLTGGIIYFMCQATGYKRQSNKELPTETLIFSQLVPKTNDAATKAADKVSDNQKWPMFAIVKQGEGTFQIELARITNVMDASYNFTQFSYGNGNMGLKFIHPVANNIYGNWETTTEDYIVNIN